jgi:hypothetical protein
VGELAQQVLFSIGFALLTSFTKNSKKTCFSVLKSEVANA